MKACVIKDPTNYKKPVGDVYVHQVGDAKAEREEWRRPEDVQARAAAPSIALRGQRAACSLRNRAHTLLQPLTVALARSTCAVAVRE